MRGKGAFVSFLWTGGEGQGEGGRGDGGGTEQLWYRVRCACLLGLGGRDDVAGASRGSFGGRGLKAGRARWESRR